MASLPPRPKSPPPTVDVRERDRGRGRGEPMASRLRDERAERPHASRGPPRPADTYIPSYKVRRDGDGRHEYPDRDRDRYRDLEWRGRHHRRDRSPPPFRRRESPTRDRDRRPPHRTLMRRHPSPRRGPFRSRSRSPRRGSPRRHRSHSRSRSHSPRRSPKSLRHRHSTSRSPSSRSPLKRGPSTSGPRSPGYRPRPGHSEGDLQADITRDLIPPAKGEKAEIQHPEKSIKQEDNDAEILFHDAEVFFHGFAESHANAASQSTNSPIYSFVKAELKIEPYESFAPTAEQVEFSTNRPTNLEVSAPTKMDFDSPRIPPPQSQSSEADPRTPLEDLPSRPIPHVLRAARSPPRGPRGYNPSTGLTQGDSSAPRVPKRRPAYLFRDRKEGATYVSIPDCEPIKLSDYRKPIDIFEMEKNVPKFRQSGQKLATEIVQQLAQLPKMFYEYELAAREVRIAESRRKIYEAHLERAKSGTLGMDYTEDDTEMKT